MLSPEYQKVNEAYKSMYAAPIKEEKIQEEMTGLYTATVKDEITKQKKQIAEIEKAFNSLKNKESDYAKEMQMLLKKRNKVLAIWSETDNA